jgi:type I restriction enzyme M protein
MPKSKKEPEKAKNGESSGLEAKLWAAADALRNNMDAAEYKHVVLGLIFLKYISDAFEAKHAELEAERKQGADPEDPDEYKARGSSGYQKRRAGHISRRVPRNRRLARLWTMR